MDKKYFLVVDDDKDALSLIEMVITSGLGLRSGHADVISVENSQLAMKYLFEDKVPFTMVIIDLRLPGSELDGIGLVKLIRETPATSKLLCVAITSYHSAVVREQAIGVGFNAYFTKPIVNSTALGRELQRVLQDHK